MSETRPKRDRINVALAGFLVLTGTMTFAVAGDAPHILVLTLLGIGGALLLKRPLARTSRTQVYSMVLVLVVTVFQDQILPVTSDRFFMGPAALFCPLLLNAGVALLFFADDEPIYCAIIAVVLFATMGAGSRLLWGADREIISWLGGVSTEYYAFYAGMVAVEIGILLLLLGRIEPRRTFRQPGGRPWLWRLGLTLAAIVMVTGSVLGLRVAARVYEHLASRMFGRFLHSYFIRRFNWVIFSENVDLYRTVPFTTAQDREIVLRARSSIPPGYLRGRAYQIYNRGRWQSTRDLRSLPVREAGGRLAYSIYTRPGAGFETGGEARAAEASPYLADLLVAGHFRSDVLLAGGGATEFMLTARVLAEDRDGTLNPLDWDRRAGYSYRFQPDAAYPAPAPPESARYLEVPQELKPPLETLLREIWPTAEPPGPATAQVDQICRLLQTRCVYDLNVLRTRRRDPVLQFLFEQRRGHCELFASAAVLLLRAQGIPARYVTGFVCVEPHPSGRYWLARLQDAHAWAEAWDAATRRWILVEATPGSGVPDGAPGFAAWAAWLDRGFYALQAAYMWLKRGYLAEAAVQVWRWPELILGQIARHPWRSGGLALGAGTMGVAWYFARRRRRENDPLLPAPRRNLCREWRSFEQGLARRGWRREPGWTLREFGRLAGWLPPAGGEAGPGTVAADVAALLHDYERLRFRAGLPAPADVTALKARFRQVRRRLQKAGK